MRPQMRVQRITHSVGVPVPAEIDMGYLSERMYARVGATGTLDAHLVGAERPNRLGQNSLHGRPAILDLPAHEGSAIIFNGELVPLHLPIRRQRMRTGIAPPPSMGLSSSIEGP